MKMTPFECGPFLLLVACSISYSSQLQVTPSQVSVIPHGVVPHRVVQQTTARPQTLLTADQIIAQLEKSTGGRVISLTPSGDNRIFLARILKTDGKIILLTIDAASGTKSNAHKKR